MSDNKTSNQEIHEEMDKLIELENLKSETAAKKAILDAKRINQQLKQMQENEKDLEITKKSNFGALSLEQIKRIQKESADYIAAAKNGMRFINTAFNEIVPFFRKNFILIGAKTGGGKSTTVANIVFSTIGQINPETGKTRRALVITNEERAEDFYNRVTCLIKGWHYTNHNKFTQEQIETFDAYIPKLASNGRLTVIDNNHDDSHGVTTTIEGIQGIFDNLIENKEYYDVVIIDYYQNIITSKNNPSMSENEAQARLARMMDNYKNTYPAPIVMMSQINAPDKEDKIPFQQRIKGRKIIMDPSTLALEMVSDNKNLRTKWIVHKSRFTESIGSDFFTGYDHGKYVEYTTEFAEKVQKAIAEREARRLNGLIDKSNGLPEVKFNDEEKK